MRPLAVALAVFAAAPGAAAPLVITKSNAVVADQVNAVNPRAIPAATLDYAIRVENPNGALDAQAIAAVTITDMVPPHLSLRVADYGAAGSGPVEFADGNLLGAGLVGSGLTYSYNGLAAGGDGLEFFDGSSWSYVPVPDAGGYDAHVRAIRVRLTGTQAAGSVFRLRFRVRLS